MSASPGGTGSSFGLGFNVVRRGYARDQVDDYVKRLSGAVPPVGPPAFDMVRRGYDRKQVDAHIGELRAQRGLSG